MQFINFQPLILEKQVEKSPEKKKEKFVKKVKNQRTEKYSEGSRGQKYEKNRDIYEHK